MTLTSTTSDRTTDPSPAQVEALPRFMPAYNGLDEGFGTAIMVESKTGEWINRAAALYAAEAEAASLQARAYLAASGEAAPQPAAIIRARE